MKSISVRDPARVAELSEGDSEKDTGKRCGLHTFGKGESEEAV
jgi:hypothetical protein